MRPLAPRGSVDQGLRILGLRYLIDSRVTRNSLLLRPNDFFTIARVRSTSRAFISFLTRSTRSTIVVGVMYVRIAILVGGEFLTTSLLRTTGDLRSLSLGKKFKISFFNGFPLRDAAISVTKVYDLVQVLFVKVVVRASSFVKTMGRQSSKLNGRVYIGRRVLASAPFRLLIVFFGGDDLSPTRKDDDSTRTNVLDCQIVVVRLSTTITSQVLSYGRVVRMALVK